MKNYKSFIVFIGFALSFSMFFGGCGEDKEVIAVVNVKYLSDTAIVVPYAHVRLHKHDINVEGVTDSKGAFKHEFRYEAILDVHAWTLDTFGLEDMYGETTIRLKKGATVTKSVFIN